MPNFIDLSTLGLSTSASQLIATWLEQMQTAFPGYQPASGNLEYIQAQIIATQAAELGQFAAVAGEEIFRNYGTKLLQLPYQNGSPASTTVTVTAVDTAGYTLPVGSQLTLSQAGAPLGFQTASALTIPPGSSSGTVTVFAVQSGSSFNGAGTPANLVTQITWVQSVVPAASASGGVDAEDDSHYLNRLTQTLQLLAPRPIVASNFAQMATNFTPAAATDQQDVGRATAIDGYDPGANTYNNQREVTVAISDSTGNPLNADTVTAVQVWLASLREANFIVNVVSPNYSTVYVACQVHPAAGFAGATVQANVQTALLNYLTPAAWGLAPAGTTSGQWTNYQTVYRSKVLSIVQNSAGVDYVENLAIGLSAGPNNTTSDVALPGAFPLPTSSTTSVPLSAITLI